MISHLQCSTSCGPDFKECCHAFTAVRCKKTACQHVTSSCEIIDVFLADINTLDLPPNVFNEVVFTKILRVNILGL